MKSTIFLLSIFLLSSSYPFSLYSSVMEGITVPKVIGSTFVVGSTLVAGFFLQNKNKSDQLENLYDKSQYTDEDSQLFKCIRKMLKARVDVRLLAISNLIAPIAAVSFFDLPDKRKLESVSQFKEKLLTYKK